MAIGALSTNPLGAAAYDRAARSAHKDEKSEFQSFSEVVQKRMDTEKDLESDEKDFDYQQFFQEHKEALFEKIKKGEAETSFQIGASSFTLKEWDRFLEKFDSAEETVEKAIQEEIEKKKKERVLT